MINSKNSRKLPHAATVPHSAELNSAVAHIQTTQLNATAAQFEKGLLRMMPNCFSSMGEGRLIAGIFRQAWADADHASSRRFFLNSGGGAATYCALVGLDHSQVKAMFEKHCASYKNSILETAQ